MRIIIQLLLIAAILVILIRMWRRTSAGTRVASRILLLLFMAVAVAVVLAPGITSHIAAAIGVGRGTDLVLYLTVIVVLYIFVDNAIWRKDHDRRFAEVVRHQALLQARLDEMALGPQGTTSAAPSTSLATGQYPDATSTRDVGGTQARDGD